jgi:hypothetical protein
MERCEFPAGWYPASVPSRLRLVTIRLAEFAGFFRALEVLDAEADRAFNMICPCRDRSSAIWPTAIQRPDRDRRSPADC